MKSRIPRYVSVVAFCLGCVDLARGVLHTVRVEHAARDVAGLDLSCIQLDRSSNPDDRFRNFQSAHRINAHSDSLEGSIDCLRNACDYSNCVFDWGCQSQCSSACVSSNSGGLSRHYFDCQLSHGLRVYVPRRVPAHALCLDHRKSWAPPRWNVQKQRRVLHEFDSQRTA
jgi:hypothetical protein